MYDFDLKPGAKKIFQDAAPGAAQFLADVVSGRIEEATVGERLTAAKLVLDRSIGTPIPLDTMEAISSADQVMERVMALEAAANRKAREKSSA